jgi:hypothetical protein
MYIANIHNKQQKPTDINVLQLRIVNDSLKIFKTQKDEIQIVLNNVTALGILKYRVYCALYSGGAKGVQLLGK